MMSNDPGPELAKPLSPNTLSHISAAPAEAPISPAKKLAFKTDKPLPNLPQPNSKKATANMMHDRRIFRGPNFGAINLAKLDPIDLAKEHDERRKKKAKQSLSIQQRITTPDAVPGRKNAAFQTEMYLEELELKIPTDSATTQTDIFMDRAPSPVYVPMKSGIDVTTQIYEGELFDFDLEVEPILEVLVGKVLEQSLMEVLEEDELASLRFHQIQYELKRNAELAEVQRLEDAERRREEEKQRRLLEQEKYYNEQKAAAEKIAARTQAQALLRDIVPSVFDALTTNGYFYDAIEREVERDFMKYLTVQVEVRLDQQATAQKILDDIIREAISTYRSAEKLQQKLKAQNQMEPEPVVSEVAPEQQTEKQPQQPDQIQEQTENQVQEEQPQADGPAQE